MTYSAFVAQAKLSMKLHNVTGEHVYLQLNDGWPHSSVMHINRELYSILHQRVVGSGPGRVRPDGELLCGRSASAPGLSVVRMSDNGILIAMTGNPLSVWESRGHCKEPF